MYCIIFHNMLYIPVLLLLNKHSFIHSYVYILCEKKVEKEGRLYKIYKYTYMHSGKRGRSHSRDNNDRW